jgi:uncharacterized protein
MHEEEMLLVLTVCKLLGRTPSVEEVEEAYKWAAYQTKKANRPTVSEETARNWKDGAERGDPESQFSFGLHQSVTGFQTEALGWYRKVAEQGHAYAQHYLGMAYANYDGVAQDYAEAYFWLNLSATCWERAKENRDEIGRRLSDAERTEIGKRCQEWIESHPKIFR